LPSTQHLSPQYRLAGVLDIKHDRKLLLWLNSAGLVITIASIFLFGWWTGMVRPDQAGMDITVHSLLDILKLFGWVALASVLVVIIHEAIHGVFFWLFTGSRPVFAFKGACAYAAAPGWYLPRGAYMFTGIAPLVILSLAGLVVLAAAPASWLTLITLALVINASGSVGDLAAVIWLARQPASCLAQDFGDRIEIYLPLEKGSLESE